MKETELRSQALDAATVRRVELKTAVTRVEQAAAAPSAKPDWRADLIREVDILRMSLDQHVEEVEGPDGLLAELAETAPRLVNKIDRIRDEHPVLCRQVAELLERLHTSDDIEESRWAVLEVLVAVAQHRQKGSDLVYEGYSVDIGGGD